MYASVGLWALWAALACALWSGVIGSAAIWMRRADILVAGVRSLWAAAACLTLAWFALASAFVQTDFALRYVASYTARNTPLVYRVAAVWAGEGGALLTWGALLACCAALGASTWTRRARARAPLVMMGSALSVAFLAGTIALASNPFAALTFPPLEGRGLHPVLQSAGMLAHPPLLYAAYAIMVAPGVIALAHAGAGRALQQRWFESALPWLVATWVMLTAAIGAGMWWSFSEPTPAAAWVWDAAHETAAVPWFLLLACFHAATAGLAERAPRWMIALVIGTFASCVLGAIATYGTTVVEGGGILSTAASWTLGALAGLGSLSALLLGTRSRESPPVKEAREGVGQLGRAAALVAHVACVGVALLLLVRTALPWIAIWSGSPPTFTTQLATTDATGAMIVVGLFASVVVWALPSRGAQAAMSPRVSSTGATVGWRMIAAGVLSVVGAVIAATATNVTELELRPGERAQVSGAVGGRWTLVSQGPSDFEHGNYFADAVAIMAASNEGTPRLVLAEARQYFDGQRQELFAPVAELGLAHTWRGTLQIELIAQRAGGRARFRVRTTPLAWSMWLGIVLVVFGGGLVLVSLSRTSALHAERADDLIAEALDASSVQQRPTAE